MYSVATKCPFCLTDNIAFYDEGELHPVTNRYRGRRKSVDFEGFARCSMCNSHVVLYFKCTELVRSDQGTIKLLGDATRTKYQGLGEVYFWKTSPPPPQPQIPKHLPPNVEAAFLEAERASASGIFTLAAGG